MLGDIEQKRKTMKYLVIFDNQGREISRIHAPKFVAPSYLNKWAKRLWEARKKQDSRADHWDWQHVEDDESE